jgi:hypothetical protein
MDQEFKFDWYDEHCSSRNIEPVFAQAPAAAVPVSHMKVKNNTSQNPQLHAQETWTFKDVFFRPPRSTIFYVYRQMQSKARSCGVPARRIKKRIYMGDK